MAAFRELWPNLGVDEAAKPVGMIVPLGGTNVAVLENGAGLRVEPDRQGIVEIMEVNSSGGSQAVTVAVLKALKPYTDLVGVQPLPALTGKRFFVITGKALGGLKGVRVRAINPGSSAEEAVLQAVVLKEKPVKVSIRLVHHQDSKKHPVPHSKIKADAKALVHQMNGIWTPQANVTFQLSQSSPAVVAATLPREVDLSAYLSTFQKLKDPAARLTMFLVERVLNSDRHPHGITDTKEGISLVGDDRTERTMAHEAGHSLGSFDGPAGHVTYGHNTLGLEMLMNDKGKGGTKIPFKETLSYFNAKY